MLNKEKGKNPKKIQSKHEKKNGRGIFQLHAN